MPRYVLIDAELDCVAGDTSLFFVRFLRTCAYARGVDVDPEDARRLTPALAAAVLDIVEGDAVGWRYVEHRGAWPPGVAGYEVYALPGSAAEIPSVYPSADAAVVARVRALLTPVAFIEKVMEPAREEPTRDYSEEFAQEVA